MIGWEPHDHDHVNHFEATRHDGLGNDWGRQAFGVTGGGGDWTRRFAFGTSAGKLER